jgi:hypothetical protein
MKKYILVIVISWFTLVCSAYSQENSYHSIQEALNHHIEELKSHFSYYDNIFIITNMDDKIALSERTFKVENGINAKFLQKKAQNYLVEVKVSTQLNYLKIDVTNYKVIKLSNKRINLVNLSNGHSYIIN